MRYEYLHTIQLKHVRIKYIVLYISGAAQKLFLFSAVRRIILYSLSTFILKKNFTPQNIKKYKTSIYINVWWGAGFKSKVFGEESFSFSN